jgi:hypothetical protein
VTHQIICPIDSLRRINEHQGNGNGACKLVDHCVSSEVHFCLEAIRDKSGRRAASINDYDAYPKENCNDKYHQSSLYAQCHEAHDAEHFRSYISLGNACQFI